MPNSNQPYPSDRPNLRRKFPYRNRNSSDRNYPDRNHDDSYNLVNTNPTVANGRQPNPTDSSYQDAYMQGRVAERRYQNDVVRTREGDGVARGMLMGIVLTGAIAALAGLLFFVDRQDEAPIPVVPVPAPAEPEPPETQTNNPQVRERMIERTRELVPVPQPQPQTPQ